MTAELLREAASKMRDRAEAATSGRWEYVAIEDEAGCSDSYVWALTGYSSIGEDYALTVARAYLGAAS